MSLHCDNIFGFWIPYSQYFLWGINFAVFTIVLQAQKLDPRKVEPVKIRIVSMALFQYFSSVPGSEPGGSSLLLLYFLFYENLTTS